jgi:hypothetical protein
MDVERLQRALSRIGWHGRIARIGKFGDYSSSALRKRGQE